MPKKKIPLNRAQRRARAQIAANTRWGNEPDRLAATKPGRDAAIEKLLDEIDPDRILQEDERLKRLKNAQGAQMARVQFAALKARRAATAVDADDNGSSTAAQ